MLKNIGLLLTAGLLFYDCNALNRRTISSLYLQAAHGKEINYFEQSILNTRKNKEQEFSAYCRFVRELRKYNITNRLVLDEYNKSEKCDIDQDICIISDDIKTIGQDTFLRDQSFSYVVLPENLLGIDTHAFSVTNISSIHIPDSTVLIAPLAFVYCKDLAEVYVSRNTYICEHAFYLCPKLNIIYRD